MPKLILEPYAGENIWDVSTLAFVLAQLTRQDVEFVFNDRKIAAKPNDADVRDVANRYQAFVKE